MSADPARERAIRLLARREHAARELVRKLTAAGVERDSAENAVAELAAEGLQSDERFAEGFVRARHDRGQGPVRIRRDLERHGIDPALIRRHLLADERDWYGAAERVARRRYAGPAGDDRREQARRRRFLAGRGFDFDQVEHALAQLEQLEP